METAAIIKAIVKQRADHLQIPLQRRMITVRPMRDDFKINRHEVFIRPGFVLTSRDPIEPVDQILKEIREFDRRFFEERARRITEIQSNVLKWTNYLHRAMGPSEYEQFIQSLRNGRND